jgi:hypothetical protein
MGTLNRVTAPTIYEAQAIPGGTGTPLAVENIPSKSIALCADSAGLEFLKIEEPWRNY